MFLARQALNMLLLFDPLSDLCWRSTDQNALASYEYGCISCYLLLYENSFYTRRRSYIRSASRGEELRDVNVVLKEIELRCDKENSEILEM